MKTIIPFKKEILFKTNVDEITSISLEHTLNINGLKIEGNFIVSGEYKQNENSEYVDNFSYSIPFLNILEEDYDTTNSLVDIDDFYYEIINQNKLSISIDVKVDNLKEKEIDVRDITIQEKKEEQEIINTITNEEYVSYNIYIIRENDSIDTIINKYNTTIEELEKYNDINNIQIGDKIIIPSETN